MRCSKGKKGAECADFLSRSQAGLFEAYMWRIYSLYAIITVITADRSLSGEPWHVERGIGRRDL